MTKRPPRRRFGFAAATLMALLVLGATLAPAKDARFLVSAPHTKEECLRALDEINATGKQLLDRCDFGCMAGDHTTYVVLEAKDVEALRKMLPPSWSNARLVKLNKFTPEQIASFHKRQ